LSSYCTERLRRPAVLVPGGCGPRGSGSGLGYVAELHFVGLSEPVIGGEPDDIASVETSAIVREAGGGGGHGITQVALGGGFPGLVSLADEHRNGDSGEVPMMVATVSLPNYKHL
jgi:hypothetical protein